MPLCNVILQENAFKQSNVLFDFFLLLVQGLFILRFVLQKEI